MKNKRLGELTKSFIEHLRNHQQREILKFLLTNIVYSESTQISLEVMFQNSIVSDGLHISSDELMKTLVEINSTPLETKKKKSDFVVNMLFPMSQIVFKKNVNDKYDLYIFLDSNIAFYLALENQDKSLQEIFIKSIELSFY